MLRTRKIHNDVTGNWDNFVGHKTVFQRNLYRKTIIVPFTKTGNRC
jgi:hypothetical protein